LIATVVCNDRERSKSNCEKKGKKIKDLTNAYCNASAKSKKDTSLSPINPKTKKLRNKELTPIVDNLNKKSGIKPINSKNMSKSRSTSNNKRCLESKSQNSKNIRKRRRKSFKTTQY